MSNPGLDPQERQRLVDDLMKARRLVGQAKASGDRDLEQQARAAVDGAKRGLGERGPAWWTDGAPDLNRTMARTSPYAEWYAADEALPQEHPSSTDA